MVLQYVVQTVKQGFCLIYNPIMQNTFVIYNFLSFGKLQPPLHPEAMNVKTTLCKVWRKCRMYPDLCSTSNSELRESSPHACRALGHTFICSLIIARGMGNFPWCFKGRPSITRKQQVEVMSQKWEPWSPSCTLQIQTQHSKYSFRFRIWTYKHAPHTQRVKKKDRTKYLSP